MTRLMPVVALLLSLGCVQLRAEDMPASEATKLCEVLGTISPGAKMKVTVAGVYSVSYENQMFYDPSAPVCDMDVEPVTWLEFSSTFTPGPRLDQYLSADHRVFATFTGTLWGPGEVKADDRSAPTMIAYANRIANRRYGHMNAFRTRFVVDSVRDVRRVPTSLPSYGDWAAPRTHSDIPRLVSGELPQYPPAAQNVGIAGMVVVEVTVGGGGVQTTNVTVGDRILAEAVLRTIATWRFDSTVEAKFTSTFLFELRMARAGTDPNPQVNLQLPTFARITTTMNGW
jgi:TonB family protein